MTSTPGTDEHPEVAEISALAEGILPPDRSADLRGHLANCALCADVRESLDEIRNLLGTLPGPPRMPADVAGRIDAALAAEALIAATTPDAASDTAPQTPRGSVSDVSRETAHVSRETVPATTRRPGGHPSASAGPGRKRPRRRWGRAALATACAAAVLGLGGLLVNSLGPAGSSAGPGVNNATNQADTFSGAQLSTRVQQLLKDAHPTKPATSGPHTENSPFSTAVNPVPSCVLDATGRSGQPLAFSKGSYQGRLAYLLVEPHPSDAAQVDAYVVDASCAANPSSGAGRVLTQHTYSRG